MGNAQRALALSGSGARGRVGAVGAVALAAGGALAVLSPTLGLWVVLGAAALAAAAVAPWVLVCAVPVGVALDTVVALKLGPLRAGPTDLLAAALVVSAVVEVARARRAPSGKGAARLADAVRAAPRSVLVLVGSLVAYLGIIVLSVVVATDRSAVLKEALKWAEVLVVLALGSLLVRGQRQRTVAVWSVIGPGVAEALLGIGQWSIGAGQFGLGGSGARVAGTFDQPNPYAAFLNLCLPVAVALAVLARRPAERWLAGAGGVLMLAAAALAQSRGGELGLAAALLVMVVVALGIERVAAPAGLVAVAALGAAWAGGIIPVGLQERILRLARLDHVSLAGPINDANFSAVERLAHWVAGLRMFQAHPILGVGAGNYGAVYEQYKAAGWNQALGHAHNYYINAAAETGVVGLVAVLAVLLAALWVAWSAANGQRPARTRGVGVWAQVVSRLARRTDAFWLGLAVTGAVAGVIVHSLVDDVFVHGMELQVALLLALSVSLLMGARQRMEAGAA